MRDVPINYSSVRINDAILLSLASRCFGLFWPFHDFNYLRHLLYILFCCRFFFRRPKYLQANASLRNMYASVSVCVCVCVCVGVYEWMCVYMFERERELGVRVSFTMSHRGWKRPPRCKRVFGGKIERLCSSSKYVEYVQHIQSVSRI